MASSHSLDGPEVPDLACDERADAFQDRDRAGPGWEKKSGFELAGPALYRSLFQNSQTEIRNYTMPPDFFNELAQEIELSDKAKINNIIYINDMTYLIKNVTPTFTLLKFGKKSS